VNLAARIRGGTDVERLAPLLGFTGDQSAIAPLIDLLYAADDSARAAADALLYLDRRRAKASLLRSLRVRGPRDVMVDLLINTFGGTKAEVGPLLVRWLTDTNSAARHGAVEGLRLLNVVNDPMEPTWFALLAARLRDPVASVRHRAASAVGNYESAAALEALSAVVDDPDPDVSTQATVAVGWMAVAPASGDALRNRAVGILRRVGQSEGRSGRAALEWLARAGEK
jgi:HEAT repeat protein